MSTHKVDFSKLPWESPLPGMRQKAMQQGTRRLRLVEYSPEMEPHWCDRGHYGYVLSGTFELEFDDAKVVCEAGDGIFIPDGSRHRHRAKVLSDSVAVVFVEDIV